VLTDIEHKGMNGVELMHTMHKKDQKQNVRIITGWPVLQKAIQRKAIA
jgi:FixJ family two-component response regulator